jgi:hypothetical protein
MKVSPPKGKVFIHTLMHVCGHCCDWIVPQDNIIFSRLPKKYDDGLYMLISREYTVPLGTMPCPWCIPSDEPTPNEMICVRVTYNISFFCERVECK